MVATDMTATNAALPVVVRALRESDIATLTEHSNANLPCDFYEAALSRIDWREKKLRVFVAEVAATGAIAGYVLVGLGYPSYFPKLDDEIVKQLYLAGIGVLPEFERRGVGLELLQFLRHEAESIGVDVVRAECAKGWLVDAFYAKIGLEPVPYAGSHDAYPDSHQMLELWLSEKKSEA